MKSIDKEAWKSIFAFAIVMCMLSGMLPIAVSSPESGGSPNAVLETKTISRNNDPVVVIGSQIAPYQGYANGNIFVWAFRGGAWQQVVFQIDEANGTWAFDNVHKRYGSDNNPGIFDSDDEICFMADETGDRVDQGTWAPGADQGKPRMEITAYDPNTGNKGWAYIFYHTTPPSWTTESYISWNDVTNSLTASNYTADYPDDDTHNSYISDLRVTSAGGGTGGQFVDRQKFYSQWRYLFITNRICEQTWVTQWSGNDDDGRTSENSLTVGPVRIIRHWRMAYSPGGTFEWGEKKSFQVFYYRSHIQTLEHGKFWGSTTHQDDRNSIDHVLTAPAAQYWDGNGNTATIDGSATGDSVGNTAILNWYQVSSPQGSYVQTSALTITTSPTMAMDFIDSSGAADTDGGRTGASAGKFGDVSMHRMQGLSNPTQWNTEYHLFLLPASISNQGAEYYQNASAPVSTTDFPPASQSYIPTDSEPPATLAGTVLAEGLATFQTTLSAAGTVALTAAVDDTGRGDSTISGAVWTLGYAAFPGTALSPADGGFDEMQEYVQASIDISSWGVGVYDIYVYGTDSASNQNTTSAEHATIIITDDLPPRILNVLANGLSTYAVPLSEAFQANVTALIDDTATGASLIAGANFTLGAGNWPGTVMTPDTPLDSASEQFHHVLDISAWLPGTYFIYVQGWDAVPAYNETSEAHATILITDDAVPEIHDVLLNGVPSLSVNLSALSVLTLTATVDDTAHGGNTVAGANYTLGMAAWPGQPMAPDGALDSPLEDFHAPIDVLGWVPGIYEFYVYGWDETNDCNVSSVEHATLTILDDIPPRILDGTAAGIEVYEVMLSAAGTVMLECTVDDTATGGSNAAGANFTVGGVWPGTAMIPDGALDSPIEKFHHLLDISVWPAGVYEICFHGWDASPSFNTTFSENAFIVIYDDDAPEVRNLMVNGTGHFTVGYRNATSIILTAVVDDSAHGSSAIAGANWTLGIGGWPGVPMSAADLAFDEVTEDVYSVQDIGSWAPGEYWFYAYAWDVTPIYNVSSMSFARLTILDDEQPDILDCLVNGDKNASVLLTDLTAQITGWVDDTEKGGSLASVGAFGDSAGNWETLRDMSVVGSVDSSLEQFAYAFDLEEWRAGSHDLYMYGYDSMGNFNNTSAEHACLNIMDDMAPSTGWSVKVNGGYSYSVDEANRTTVWINATVTDEMRGFMNITSANCTVGSGIWPGQPMDPLDGAFDNATETVTLQYNISAWPVGTYRFHVYGTDEAGNGNVSAAEYATLNIEGMGPEINSVTADNLNPYFFASDSEFILKAFGDDRQRGGSIIIGAEFFVDAPGQNGTGAAMSPTGYKFDSPYEGAKALVSCLDWTPGEYHIYYIHFQDANGYWGDWGSVAVCRQTQLDIPVSSGWNLISLPLATASGNIANILSGISWDRAFIYDPLDPNPWLSHRKGGPAELNSFTNVDVTMGIWMHATANGILTISGGVPTSTAITLHAGWNLVGYPTLTENISALDALAGTGADMIAVSTAASPFIMDIVDLSTVTMAPGSGYWMHVPSDVVWTVNW